MEPNHEINEQIFKEIIDLNENNNKNLNFSNKKIKIISKLIAAFSNQKYKFKQYNIKILPISLDNIQRIQFGNELKENSERIISFSFNIPIYFTNKQDVNIDNILQHFKTDNQGIQIIKNYIESKINPIEIMDILLDYYLIEYKTNVQHEINSINESDKELAELLSLNNKKDDTIEIKTKT